MYIIVFGFRYRLGGPFSISVLNSKGSGVDTRSTALQNP